MRLRIGNYSRQQRFPAGMTLGEILGPHAREVDNCAINGDLVSDWSSYRPRHDDTVTIYPRAGAFFIPIIISFLINLAISAILSALTAKPKKPSTRGPAAARNLGVAGISNTIDEGTPIPVYHGEQRIFPHIIGSKTRVAKETGGKMSYAVLYLVGDTGGDGYEDISAPQLNESAIENYKGATWGWRAGTVGQAVVPGFENVEQTFYDGRSISHDSSEVQSITVRGTPTGGTYTITVPTFGTTSALAFNADGAAVQTALRAISGLSSVEVNTTGTSPNYVHVVTFFGTTGNIGKMTIADSLTPNKAKIKVFTIEDGSGGGGTAIVYSTRTQIDQAVLIFQVQGLFDDELEEAFVKWKIERKKTSEGAGAWTVIDTITWSGKSESPLFKQLTYDMPTKDAYDFRFSGKGRSSKAGPVVLFNVGEVQFTTRTYDGFALAWVEGVGSKSITSLDSMKTSFLVKGHKCRQPLLVGGNWDGSTFTNIYTQKRLFITGCVFTDPDVGLGYRFPTTSYDWAAAVAEQPTLDATVTGYNGSEPLDLCNHMMNERKPGLDYLKEDILGEGRAFMFPSGGKWKPVVRKAKSPNLLWTNPGNIAEDSEGGAAVKRIIAFPEGEINQVRVTFRDQDDNYKTAVIEWPETADIVGPIKPKEYQLDSITRRSEAYFQAMFLYKDLQIKDRWQFAATMSAQPSEPGDVDYLRYSTANDKRGWGGRVPRGCTTTTVLMPSGMQIELLSGKTYEIIVQHRSDNVVEKRTISTAAGKWRKVTVSSAFTTAPAKGDWFGIGEQNVHIPTVWIESWAPSPQNGTIKLNVAKYDATMFTPATLPSAPALRPVGPVAVPPIPLSAVAVAQQLVANQDGTFSNNLIFDVTPGLPLLAGKAQSGSATNIRLPTTFPAIDGYFTALTAKLKIIAGTGSGQERGCSAYNGTNKDWTPDSNFSPAPDSTSEFEIRYDRFGVYEGFVLEVASSATANDFQILQRVKGTHFEIASKNQGLTEVYRFTPYSNLDAENGSAVWTKTITTAGDVTAPPAPTSVAITSHLKTISIESGHARPLELDFAGVEIEIWKDPKQNNLLTQPDDISHADWTKTNLTVTANQVAGPDGQTNADKLLETTTNGEHRFEETSAAFTANSQVVAGVFIAGGLGRDWVKIFIEDPAAGGNNVSAIFDITNGVLGTVANAGNGSLAAASIEKFINGMYYCRLTGKVGASPTTAKMRVLVGSSSSVFSYAGDVTKGVYAVGATLKVGTLTSDLIKDHLRDAAPQDDAKTGTLVMRKSLPLDAESYGTIVLARVRSVDFTNNASAWRNPTAAVTLTQVITGDVQDNAISAIYLAGGNFTAETIVDEGPTISTPRSVTFTARGGPVLIRASCLVTNNKTTNKPVILRLKRGSTQLANQKTELAGSGGANQATLLVIDFDQPPAGSVTYSLEVTSNAADFSFTVESSVSGGVAPYLECLELMK